MDYFVKSTFIKVLPCKGVDPEGNVLTDTGLWPPGSTVRLHQADVAGLLAAGVIEVVKVPVAIPPDADEVISPDEVPEKRRSASNK